MVEITLFDSDSIRLSIQYLYSIAGYITYRVTVKSGDFSGTSSFCQPVEEINRQIDDLRLMENELSGTCRINDIESDAFIVFDLLDLGHISAAGLVGSSFEAHSMRFALLVDQTVLPILIHAFTSFLDY